MEKLKKNPILYRIYQVERKSNSPLKNGFPLTRL